MSYGVMKAYLKIFQMFAAGKTLQKDKFKIAQFFTVISLEF